MGLISSPCIPIGKPGILKLDISFSCALRKNIIMPMEDYRQVASSSLQPVIVSTSFHTSQITALTSGFDGHLGFSFIRMLLTHSSLPDGLLSLPCAPVKSSCHCS